MTLSLEMARLPGASLDSPCAGGMLYMRSRALKYYTFKKWRTPSMVPGVAQDCKAALPHTRGYFLQKDFEDMQGLLSVISS